MIVKGSRYSEKTETRDDNTNVIATSSSYSTDSYYSVVSEQNDTFERLAGRYLNNSTLYWKIADINKQVRYPDVIPTGTSIRIPLK